MTSQIVTRSYTQKEPNYSYITTPIFYVNAAPHIGHLYSAALADCLARYNLLQGRETFFSTGTDEHGNKVQQAAKSFHLPTSEYCGVISQKFLQMCDTFSINYTNFIRTTNSSHHDAVQHFWKILEQNGHIYKGEYAGWYCTSDESFLSDKDLVEKKTPSGEVVRVSAESGHVVEWTEETNFKFRLSKFQDDLKYWLKQEDVVQPSVFHKILSQMIDNEDCLSDLSVSRPRKRSLWGIPTPNDSDQTVYVWLDALVNYLTSLGYPDEKFRKFWPPTVQVIGKDILKFHGVYWPAFLIAAGLEPPRTLFCHSHWTVDGEKMSKSKGNVVSPFDAGELFTEEGLRYFLLRDSVPHNDSNYSTERVLNILNSELADNLGNLVSRCSGKLVNPRGEIPNITEVSHHLKSEPAESLRKNMESLGSTAKQHYESFYIHHVIDAVMATLKRANVMIDHHKPWELRKRPDDVEAMTELKAVLALALESARISAIVLYPVTPKLSTNLLDFLNVPEDSRSWKDISPKYLVGSAKDPEHFKYDTRILFPKIKLKA
ncbi:hypothetical protein QAD02_022805 [Eretmocerus hayati]|uniref:Uncharacterized protein n=1 Tax=Eretmocerus hayati TaxID=131215 RepID=A0ACC2PW52_9HYME|nr:hypothetical protein QAD02_022805 [Eretmocerus hayati]